MFECRCICVYNFALEFYLCVYIIMYLRPSQNTIPLGTCTYLNAHYNYVLLVHPNTNSTTGLTFLLVSPRHSQMSIAHMFVFSNVFM